MRVIAGKHKGRQLKAVSGKNTRPTTDKVKESIFQMMGPFFDGGNCLDLFAGSGSLGIEAISRGMNSCIFVDKSPQAIAIIKENIRTLKLEAQSEVYRADALRALHAAGKRNLCFDLIFLDPPYGKVNYTEILDILEKSELIKKDSIIYCEHGPKDALPEHYGAFSAIKQTHFGGSIGITIYRRLTDCKPLN